jgi:methylmalonyl-CoA mutase N-terminal domain/subunit
LDVAELDYELDLGLPGEYPFTRGIHATMHRSRLWTMRMFAGFGTAEETNARFKFLLEEGQTGLSIAFDLATLMGYDSDAPEALGEFGKCGVAVSSLRDMEILLDGIPLDKVSTSMTINSPAAIIWAMYIATAEKQGVRADQLRGTTQNDILKEYIAQKEYIFPPEPSMRLVVDTIEYGMQNVPQWNPVSISGYHIREAGSTAAQELAFTLADGMEYVRWSLERGLDIDQFAPRSLFLQRTMISSKRLPSTRCSTDLGTRDAPNLQRQTPALLAAAFPHSNRRGFTHRTATGKQYRASHDPGAGCCAGRHAITAYQQHG